MSGGLIAVGTSCLIAIDFQERLAPVISGREEILRKAALLLRAAARLEVPVLLTEQYPKGLGPTLPEIAQLAPQAETLEKAAFSALAEPGIEARWRALDRRQAVLLGTEAHVCVLQTGLDILKHGGDLFVVADAVGSRGPADARAALGRLEQAGATIVTAEMVVFEWLRRAGTQAFRDLLPFIK